MSATPSAETRAAVDNSNTSAVQTALSRDPSEAPWVLQQLVRKRAWKALLAVFAHPRRGVATHCVPALHAWCCAAQGGEGDHSSPLERALSILFAAALCSRSKDAEDLAIRCAAPHYAALGPARTSFWQLVRQLSDRGREDMPLAVLALHAHAGAKFSSPRERESFDQCAASVAHHLAVRFAADAVPATTRTALAALLAEADDARTKGVADARSALTRACAAVEAAASAAGGAHLSFSVAGFGSLTTALAGGHSDLDLCALVAQPEASSPTESDGSASGSASAEPHTPQGFLALVAAGLAADPALTAGATRAPQLLTDTRIPLLRATLRLAPQGAAAVAAPWRRVDVVVNAARCLANSALVAAVLDAGDARAGGALRPALQIGRAHV